jgi:hypothetical protein
MHLATSRKDAASIPHGVIETYQFTESFIRIMEHVSMRNLPGGVKRVRPVMLTPSPPVN